jgi:hypothetical protein
MEYVNFGDASPAYGQLWIANDGASDYAPCVEILSGRDIGLADNQYMITRGSIYFSPDRWNAALLCLGNDTIGPPKFLEIAYAYSAYQGFDRDTWGGVEIVQVGKKLDDWTASGSTCDDPDVILHGNASIRLYLQRNHLKGE